MAVHRLLINIVHIVQSKVMLRGWRYSGGNLRRPPKSPNLRSGAAIKMFGRKCAPRNFIFRAFLPPGPYRFAGTPKIGTPFTMTQLCLCASAKISFLRPGAALCSIQCWGVMSLGFMGSLPRTTAGWIPAICSPTERPANRIPLRPGLRTSAAAVPKLFQIDCGESYERLKL